MIRVDDAFLAVVDQSLRPGETRSAMIRDAALEAALRRQVERPALPTRASGGHVATYDR